MGFDPNLTIFITGIGTILFFLITGGRLPSYLGSSFAFIGAVVAVTGYSGVGANPNIGLALGGTIACGIVYALIGLLVMKPVPTGLKTDAASSDRRDCDDHWFEPGASRN